VPHVAEGDMVRSEGDNQPGWLHAQAEDAIRGPETVHRVRHLREQMPRAGQGGDKGYQRGGDEVEDEPDVIGEVRG